MTKIRRISVREGLLSILIIPIFILAAIASFVWLQQTAEGWEGLFLIIYIYSWIGFAICAIPLLISAIGLMSSKKKGYTALSIVGIVAKVLAEFVVFTFGAQAVVDTPSAIPYVVLMAYILFTIVMDVLSMVQRKKAKAEEDAEDLFSHISYGAEETAEDTATAQEDYKV